MKIKIDVIKLEKEELQRLLKNNKFEEENLAEFREVYQEIQARLNLNIYFECVELTGYLVITLGAQIDTLQQEYMQKGEMLKAFMLDSLAHEFLAKIYDKIPEFFSRERNYYLKQLQFPGAQIPIEEMQTIFEICKPEKISYNESYMLIPTKSVALIAELTTQKPDSEYKMCQQCTNLECLSRDKQLCQQKYEERVNLNYGYQRIFKK